MGKFTKLAALTLAATALPSAAGAAIVYEAHLDGPSSSPPNASPGTGHATATYDAAAHTLALHVDFSGLLGTTTAAHIHAATATPFTGTAGVATTVPSFAGFPIGVTSGTFDNILDLTQATSFSPTFVTANGGTMAGAEAALAAALADGKAYLNIHTTVVPGGEIRGFFTPAVPEPASWAMMIGGFALAGGVLRGRRGKPAAA